ncbi:putative late blight resistance protein homolog R1A-3 [Nicotiana tabacum]|uniref:Late blight resistance protein homolog R1A-3 n=1 Tax=Nicotiana tabacum TaxID=4097 RepID=A0AC58SP16_TOBAC
MATVYAAVTSLMGTIQLISQSTSDLQEGHREHLKLLYDKVGSLQELLDTNSDDKPMKDLRKKVIDLTHEAEDEVESQLRLVMEEDEDVQIEANERLLENLQQVIEDIDSVKEELIKQRKNNNLQAGNHSVGGSSSPLSHVSALENDVISIEEERMRDQLTRGSSELEVISIVGMSGIGKSTFARKMYSDPSIASFYDVRGWITVSKDYSIRNMLLYLLRDAIGMTKELDKRSDGELAERLRKHLMAKRYLIVVDDIWSREAWDDVRLCFPENNNRSRILLTTRDMKVAQYASSPKDLFQMRLLNPKERLSLFCQKVFGNKDCPTEFENVAKEIAEHCKGLPLAISLVAGILSSKRTVDEWREVAQILSINLETDMVGYKDEQESMRGKLTGHSSQLEVISIAGMGGIGKSTFAKKMFSDPSILEFFDVRGWITVSRDYSVRKMLLSLLQDATAVKENLDNVSDGDLAGLLKKRLNSRRYLIVVDDIWSIEAWDDIRQWFPENSNTSRILLTTRDMKVARYASSPKDPFPMRFLEPKESWNLFCQKAFAQKVCPLEFEDVAKEVVRNCEGFPLMISVVAGTLFSKKTLNEWEEVAESVSSFADLDDYQRCSGVLALSYNHLPSNVKACFLYFGVFPKAREIPVKKLIRLWVAEGLLELKGVEVLEKVAANLLQEFIDKSLVVVSKRSLDGKIKTFRIHDLLHDFCLREAEEEKILYVANSMLSQEHRMVSEIPQGRRWVSVHPDYGQFPPILFDDHSNPTILFDDLTHRKTRSLHHSSNEIVQRHDLGLVHFKLLRVLDLETMRFGLFPSEILHLVSLRYLAVMVSSIPKDMTISNLLNLQTFIFPQYVPELSGTIDLPIGIWEMSQLRHLYSTMMYLYSPPMVSANEVSYRVLENLQSVSGLSPRCCTEEIFEAIKKVKNLGISGSENEFHSEPRCLDNLIYLHELEALSIVSYSRQPDGLFLRLPHLDSFPPNLKKLTLRRTWLSWEDMTIISELPELEVLQLKEDAFAGNTVWEVTKEGFPKLKFLLLEELDLGYWVADDDYFPCLERIIIRNCTYLKEIPQGFADSTTLQQIELRRCSPSLVTLAEKIQKKQEEEIGNNILKVCVFDTKESDSEVGYEETAEEDI